MEVINVVLAEIKASLKRETGTIFVRKSFSSSLAPRIHQKAVSFGSLRTPNRRTKCAQVFCYPAVCMSE